MKNSVLIRVVLIGMMLCSMGMTTYPDIHAPLETLTVDTTEDDWTLWGCEPAVDDDCSLRGAIYYANNNTAELFIINVPADTYTLTGLNGDNINLSGDLDVREPMTIIGAGKDETIIQAATASGEGTDRVIEIRGAEGAVLITDLTIRYGRVITGSDGGAGVFQASTVSDLTLERVTITENEVVIDGHGGGILSQGTLNITDSTISNNSTTAEGGGLYDTGDTVTILRSTISGNTANIGGGYANNNVALLRNVTISGNDAVTSGGGISQWNTGDLTLYNATVYDNTVTGGATSGWAIDDSRTFTSFNSIFSAVNYNSACVNGMDSGDHNLATDDSCGGTNLIVGRARLGPLKDNGGYTWTHHLIRLSPAIDAGATPVCELKDQRGVTRPQDGDNDGSAVCDMGAYEKSPAVLFLPLLYRP
jgi:hypothetical protein